VVVLCKGNYLSSESLLASASESSASKFFAGSLSSASRFDPADIKFQNHSYQKQICNFLSFFPVNVNEIMKIVTSIYLPSTLHLLKMSSCDPGHLVKKHDPHVSANIENLEQNPTTCLSNWFLTRENIS
jgi:hypothetical protein